MFGKDMIDEDFLEIYGTQIKIKDVKYEASESIMDIEELKKLNPRPYKLMNNERISFNCEEIETGKNFEYIYNLTLDRREIQTPITSPNMPAVISFDENSFLRQEESKKLKEILLSSENLQEPLSKAILEHNLVEIDKELALNLLDNGRIEVAKYIPETLTQDKEVTNRLLEEFNKYDIAKDFEPNELSQNPEYLIGIISNIDWSKEEIENQNNLEF